MGDVSATRLMVVGASALFLYGMIASTLGTLLPRLSERFGFTPEQNGMVALAQAMGLMLASIGAGLLIDNKGKKVGLLIGVAAISVALLGLPSSSGLLTVMASMFVLGLGGGTCVTGSNTVISDLSEEKRGSMLSLAHVFFGVGALLTPLLAANVLGRNPILLAYVVTALATVTLIFYAATPMPAPARERSFSRSQARRLEGKPLLAALSLFMFLYVSCEVGFWNWLPRHLMAKGISESHALNILSLGFALGMLLGRLAGVWILRTWPTSRVSLVFSVLMVATTTWSLESADPMLAWASVFCAGFAMGPVFPSVVAMTGDAFPRMTGTCIGIVVTSGFAGLAASSWLIGVMAGTEESRLPAALLLLPAFSAGMVAVNLLIRSLPKPKAVASIEAGGYLEPGSVVTGGKKAG